MYITCVHQGYELYGSDRSFVESVQAIRAAFPTAEIEVVLPRSGAIGPLLQDHASRITVEPLWILRRRNLRSLATIGMARLPRAILRAWRRIRRSDLVYINTTVVADYILAARLCPRRCIVHVHEIPEGAVRSLLRLMLRWSDADIIFNSRATAGAFALPARHPARVIYNGVDGPARPQPCTYRGDRRLRLLMLGRISRIKGQDILIEAIAKLPDDIRPDVRIVGNAFEDPGRERDLARTIGALGLGHVVTLMPFENDPSSHYVWADVVAVPSRLPESLGRVAIEAMAHGRPPVVSAIGGLKEVVEDGRTGWLVRPGSAEDLSAVLEQIVRDPDAWRGFPGAARQRYEAFFARAPVAAALKRGSDHGSQASSSRHGQGEAEPVGRRGRDVIARLHRAGRRFAIVLGGEGLQSAFGFGLNVALARTLPAESYGEFALVMLIGGFALIYMRALIGIPACTFIPQCRSARAAGALAVTFASGALAISALGGLAVAAVLALYGCDFAWAAGLFISLGALRGYHRIAFFAQLRAPLATVSDFAFTVSASLFCVPLLRWHDAAGGLSAVFGALAVAHLVGIAMSLALQGGPCRISCRRSVRRRLRKLLPTMRWSLVSVTVANIQAQGPTFAIAAIAGPAGYAPIAATMAFFSPLRLAASALANMNQPDLAAAIKRSGDVRRLMAIQTGIIAAICLTYGAAMAIAFPFLTHRLLDGRFGEAPLNGIALGIWAIASVSVLYSVPKTLLETTQNFRQITLVSALGASIGIPVVTLIVWITTPAWSLVGTTVSELVVFLGCWVFAPRALRVQTPVCAARGAQRFAAGDHVPFDVVPARFVDPGRTAAPPGLQESVP